MSTTEEELEAWINLIDQRLGKRKNSPPNKRELFAHTLLKIVPEALAYKELAMPDNDDVKAARHEVKKITHLITSFSEKVKDSPCLLDLETNVSTVFLDSRGCLVDLKLIEKYFHFFSEHIQDVYILSQKQRGASTSALAVCQFICRAYKRCFGEEPGSYNEDRIGQSGDEADGTPYERVCRAVAEKFQIELPWTTQKRATETYTTGLVDFDAPFRHDTEGGNID
jgi:hypothetical protein